jgi:hypothetical protein
MILLTNQTVKASNPLGPTLPTPPVQGCITPAGAKFTTCAFYVVASSNDAGMKPECFYTIDDAQIYFGECLSGSMGITSGFRFQNVSIPIPTGQTILSSYIEFTVDGAYTNKVTTSIYGQAPNPTPAPFSGTNSSDITNRPTVQPTKQWIIESAARVNNMGDPWSLSETRRTPDVTLILNAIKGNNWQASSNVAFLFKSDYDNSTAARRVIAFERAEYKPARLVARVGEIPKPSVSYYWQSLTCSRRGTGPLICTPNADQLNYGAKVESRSAKKSARLSDS